MVKRAEALAEFYKQNGWEDAANVLEADAQRFREAGMPDDFRGKTPRGRKEKRTFTPLPSELKVRLIQILSDVQLPDVPRRQKHILQTDGLAERINQDVGQYVADDTRIHNLWVKEEGSYELFGDEFTHLGEYRIDKRVVYSFNSLLSTLDTIKFDRTVGDIRTASLADLVYGDHLREDKARFIRKALAPMNSSQETLRRSLEQPNDKPPSPRIYRIR